MYHTDTNHKKLRVTTSISGKIDFRENIIRHKERHDIQQKGQSKN